MQSTEAPRVCPRRLLSLIDRALLSLSEAVVDRVGRRPLSASGDEVRTLIELRHLLAALIDERDETNRDLSEPFELQHGDQHVSGRVEVRHGGLEIYLDGYGVYTMNPGFGAPLYLEISPDDGHVRLYVWADINQEDYTHVIDLEAAREAVRKEAEEE